MSQIDVDQRNTNALIATAIMYQKQRNDLLAALKSFVMLHDTVDRELKVDAGLEFTDDGCDCDVCIKARAAIAAAKGEK